MKQCRRLAKERIFVFLMIWVLIAEGLSINAVAAIDNTGDNVVLQDISDTNDTSDGVDLGTKTMYEVSVSKALQNGTATLSRESGKGSNTGKTTLSVERGEKVIISPRAKNGYAVKAVYANDDEVLLDDNKYKVEVTRDTEIDVKFVEVHTLTVTMVGTTDGSDLKVNTVAGEYFGKNGEGYIVEDKATVEIRVMPGDGYYIESVSDNSNPATSFDGDDKEDGSSVYRIKNITEDKGITIRFAGLDIAEETWDSYVNIKDLGSGNSISSMPAYNADLVYICSSHDGAELALSDEGARFYDQLSCKMNGEESYSNWQKKFIINKPCYITGIRARKQNAHNEKQLNIGENDKKIYILFDADKPSIITSKPALPTGCTHYNGNVSMKYEVLGVPNETQSKIRKVEYLITKDAEASIDRIADIINGDSSPEIDNFGENSNLQKSIYENDDTIYAVVESSHDGLDGIQDEIEVSKEKFNCDNVKVTIVATDENDRKAQVSEVISINSDMPVIDFGQFEEDSYYQDTATVRVNITDRQSTFEPQNVTLKLTATDAQGKSVDVRDKLKDENGNNLTIEEVATGKNGSQKIYYLTNTKWEQEEGGFYTDIKFPPSANYKLSVSYTNAANTSVQSDNISFTVDEDRPEATIAIDKDTKWNKAVSSITYGVWRKEPIKNITVSAGDAISSVAEIKYYKYLNLDSALSEEDIKKLNFESIIPTIKPNERAVVYAKVTDRAGNSTYISTNGLIVDTHKSEVTSCFGNQVGDGASGNVDSVLYTAITLKVSDIATMDGDDSKTAETASSGIKSIYCWVTDKDVDEKQIKEIEDGTGDGEDGIPEITEEVKKIYAYTLDSDMDNNEEPLHPKYDELCFAWNRAVKVKNDLIAKGYRNLVVQVKDNAGNVSNKVVVISGPEISVDFTTDSKGNIVNQKGYFRDKREAEITIKDRKEWFSKTALENAIQVEVLDISGNAVVDASGNEVVPKIERWDLVGTNDGMETYKTEICFEDEANYTWSINYTNRVGISAGDIVIDKDDQTPFDFCIDKTCPTGCVMVDGESWTEPFWTEPTQIEFGVIQKPFNIFKQNNVTVKFDADDALSPRCDLEYCYFENGEEISMDSLKKKHFYKYEESDKGVTVCLDKKFVICLKITDCAKNTVYICSDGHIIEDNPSNVILTPTAPNYNNKYYNKDVKSINIQVDVDETPENKEVFSGIKTITCQIYKDGQMKEEKVFTYSSSPELKEVITENLVIDTSEYNSSNVQVKVTTMDNATNELAEPREIKLDIDTTVPTIDISYESVDKGDKYYNKPVTATVKITERTCHFDAEAATKAIKITAKNAKGEEITLDDLAISRWSTQEAASGNPDEATHTATIAFSKDANYTLGIDEYADMAGNKALPVNEEFTLDTTAPTGVVKVTTKDDKVVEESRGLVTDLTFDTFTNDFFTITAEAEDDVSAIKEIKYYIHYGTSALTKNDLENLEKTGKWQKYKPQTISEDTQYVFYLKIMDEADNVGYISTDGLIVDKEPSRIDAKVKSGAGIHNSDVTVDVSVIDPIMGDAKAGATCSGIKSVTYKIFNMGEETESGKLYPSGDVDKNERIDELSGLKIRVDSQKNNSNDVVVKIYSTDNATNEEKPKEETMKKYVTKPTNDIRYNNNSPGDDGYYKDERVATIEIRERNFDPDDVKITITNTDGTVPSVSGWSTSKGGGNQDGTTHTAKIVYSADGEYTFGIDYTDEAGNRCEKVEYASGTLNPTKFIIDQTDPKVTVRYDQNNVRNGKYFKDARVATVTITERNFKLNKVEFTQTASIGGAAISVPAVSWSHRGDVHIATIPYTADGDYTFDVKVGDMAGNETLEADYGDSASPKSFTIDRNIEEPIITGVEDGKAYKGDVIPSISFSDLNFDDYVIRLTRTRMAEKDKDVTALYIEEVSLGARGGSVTSDTFEKIQDNDGIYTLYAKVTDKAGNERENTVTFTVNRFGSVYEYSDYLISLIENGGAYAQEIEKDLVITEYNADRLLSGSMAIEITRDGRPLTDIKYDVSPEINGRVAVGESGWYQYTYTISKDNFTEDGIYKMFISSKDATGNAPETTNYKDKNILFRVDATKPELTSVVGLENSIVNANELAVSYTVYDAIGLKSIQVYLDDKLVGDAITDFAADVNNYSGSFKIPSSNTAQKVKLVIVDLAGNVTDTSAADFESAYAFSDTVTVSTNLFIRWYANKALFWGSIAAVAAVSFSIMFFILAKRKKKRN